MATEFNCHQDAGFDCSFEITDEDEQELIDFVQIHGRSAHDETVSESEVRDMIGS